MNNRYNKEKENNMEYITTKEASAKWGISPIRITVLANEGRIPGAQRLGRSWLIPANATKPPERKANHSKVNQKENRETDTFSFPLYHFRPDWSYIKENQLTNQQKQLLQAGTAVVECRFTDAYPILKSILQNPDNTITEMGALWYAGISCIGLNKPDDFSRIYLRLQMLLSEDFPHKDDLSIILDTLKTYIVTISDIAEHDTTNTDIHDQCLPLMCVQNGYSILSREAMNPGSADTGLLELNLRFINATSSTIAMEMMHIYLLGIYYFRLDMESAKKHAKAAVLIAYENKVYFPLVTYYRYFNPVLSPILKEYPAEFENHFQKLVSQFEENFTSFLTSIGEDTIMANLSNIDYLYIYSVMMDLPNADIAKKLGVSPRTVNRRLGIISEKLGVNNKKELKNYLHKNM